MSLSARRAWIEIQLLINLISGIVSLSARRAWIEMRKPENRKSYKKVALRKESVDRNIVLPLENNATNSRSPQGERG